MNQLHPEQKDLPSVISLRTRAEDNLRYIRVALVVGFGGLHIGFGLYIWRNHGG